MSSFGSLRPFEGQFLLNAYSNLPKGRYVHILLARRTRSEAIFRTEGTGEPLSREITAQSDLPGAPSIERVVITKRKQIAVERRTGRELLRDLDLLHHPLDNKGKDEVCLLNHAPCERCIDCMLYGYAVGSGGAQRARVLSEDAYSLLSDVHVVDTRTGNATYDNGTMRHPTTGKPSQALYESEYVKPEVCFLDVQTLKDVQIPELAYVLGNIMRSTRYGAIGTRIGKMTNHVLGLVFSHHEVISNLEWTQHTAGLLLKQDSTAFSHPLSSDVTHATAIEAARSLIDERAIGNHAVVVGDQLDTIISDVKAAYSEPSTWLAPLADAFDAIVTGA